MRSIRKLTVSGKFLRRSAAEIEVPSLTLQGKWLEALGFTPGCTVEVWESRGEITIWLPEGGREGGKSQVHDQSGR
ncbi:SymE family type I addiction module toxin [Paenibacillus sp. SI8]|uniref:SymE family type I addiction module toxin n=1 Tax=unclassified Paenibacillus TaxID=185978 RepID=UPI00346666E2